MIPSVTLTSAGAALLAKTPAGESVPVTRWQIGTGALEPETSLDRTALVSPLKYIGVYSVTNKENQATVLGQFTNQGMDAFDFEELALLAQDPDIGEILMCYGNAFGQGEAIQAGTAQLREFIFGAQLTFYGQANVTAQVDQSLVFIPLSQKGQPDGVASLDGEGKVPEEQLPEMNYDPAGSANTVQENLTDHIEDQDNPHGVTAEQAGAAPLNFTRSHLFGTSSESSSDWIEIGRCKLSGTYQSRRFLFSVCGLNGRGSGILSLSLRVDGTAGKLSAANSYLRWLTLDLAAMKDIFAVEMDGEYAVLYLKIFGSYQCYHIGMLDYGVNSTEFVSPTDPEVFQFETNWMLQGNHKASITAALTSTSIFTPDIFGAAASGWVNGRLLVGGSTGGVTQLGHPSSAGSVLRSGTSGGPYWTSIADLIAAMGAVRIKCGTYTGNGEYDSESSYTSVPQTINLGLKPKAVLVMSETGGMDSGSGRYYGGLVWDGSDLVVFLDTNYGDINAKVITLTNSGFTVYAQRVQMSSSSYRYIATNEDGRKYRYIVFY